MSTLFRIVSSLLSLFLYFLNVWLSCVLVHGLHTCWQRHDPCWLPDGSWNRNWISIRREIGHQQRGKEGEREGGKEGGREGERQGGRERGREGENTPSLSPSAPPSLSTSLDDLIFCIQGVANKPVQTRIRCLLPVCGFLLPVGRRLSSLLQVAEF